MRTSLMIIIMLLIVMVILVACGGNSQSEAQSNGDATGQTLFIGTCAACHGPTGEGVTGLGKDLTTSEFVSNASDEELLDLIKTGRPAGHPDNTTGIDMPPKGGNPDLTDEELLSIITYVRSIHKE